MSTIFALASAAGKSGIAVFRISGPKVAFALKKLGIDPLPKARVASLRKLIRADNQEIIDEALVLWFDSPASYTGEDVAELHIHGGRAIITELVQYLSSIDGLRMAEAGEFSRRAFDNGKMDLTMLEGVADLIDAETSIQKKQALRQMQGELEVLYEGWRARIITILSHIEAYIDFPDEDIPADVKENIAQEATSLIADLNKHLANRQGERLRNGIYATIIGAPNVGKSSLMNMLARRDVAIVSSIAGTTRDVIEVHMDIAGYPLILADTAGLRETSDEIEAQGVALARKRAEHADINICLFDALNLDSLDKETIKMIDDNSLIVVNKSDLVAVPDDFKIAGQKTFPISVETGQGVDELLHYLEARLENYINPTSDPVFTRERHRNSLQQAVKCLNEFLEGQKTGLDIELCAEELRSAAGCIGSVTGKIDVEDLLDEIFSSFCIGK